MGIYKKYKLNLNKNIKKLDKAITLLRQFNNLMRLS